jgi:SAM-dependent methyltransferase
MKRPVPCDYDTRPGRMRLAREVLRDHAAVADVHARVAARLAGEWQLPVLDVGCGEGALASHLPAWAWRGIDSSPTMIAGAPAGARVGDARSLPFADDYFGSVALLYVLYHLEDPAAAIREARRVTRGGGLVAVAAPSRHDSPELAHALPRRELTFDAELAPRLMADHFESVEIDAWDGPFLELPNAEAVRDYLVGKGTEPAAAARAAAEVEVPLSVTKRGALVWGRV